MNTFEKFKQIKDEEKRKEQELLQREKARREHHKKWVKDIYKIFVQLIKPFNGQKIDGNKITLKFKPRENTVEMSINGEFYRSFRIYIETIFCNCSSCAEGGWGHEPDYRVSLDCRGPQDKRGLYPEEYFGWNHDEDTFVMSMKKVLEKYEDERDEVSV